METTAPENHRDRTTMKWDVKSPKGMHVAKGIAIVVETESPVVKNSREKLSICLQKLVNFFFDKTFRV